MKNITRLLFPVFKVSCIEWLLRDSRNSTFMAITLKISRKTLCCLYNNNIAQSLGTCFKDMSTARPSI